MTNAQVINLILQRLGNRRSTPDNRQMILLEIITFLEGKEKSMEEVPYFLETEWEGSTTAATIALPSDFLKELEESTMIITDPAGKPFKVTKRIHDDVQDLVASNAPTVPRVYSILGGSLHFGPAPDKSYSFKLPYGRKSVSFVDNEAETSDWLKEATNAVVASVCYNISLNILQDAEMASRFSPQATEAWKMFADYCNARKYTNLNISAGDV